MNAKDLQSLIVLRNHAQSILNGARADLKLTKEDKSSLMNGLKKVDELFIKKFEASVDALNTSSKSRTWTSTESEEVTLNNAIAVASTSTVVTVPVQSKEVAVAALADSTVKNEVVEKKTKRGFKRA